MRVRLLEPNTLQISTTTAVCRALAVLTNTGLFGTTPEDVAEELLRAKLRELQAAGWFR